MLFHIQLVHFVDGKWRRREVVVVVERAEEVRLVILFDYFSIFRLVRAVDATRKDRLDVELAETHRDEISLIGLYLGVVQRVVHVALDSRMQHGHLALVFQQKRSYDRTFG